jgi:hypothetical protein
MPEVVPVPSVPSVDCPLVELENVENSVSAGVLPETIVDPKPVELISTLVFNPVPCVPDVTVA